VKSRSRQRRRFAEKRERRRRLQNVLLVLAIVSILATIAIPAVYRTAVRGQILVAMARCEPMLREIELYRAQHREFPTSNAEAGFRPPEDYRSDTIATIHLKPDPAPGSLHVRFDIEALGDANTVVLSPLATGSGVDWTCLHSSLEPEFRPNRCTERASP
jgi:Tfp pilus assembly major pilin PilA